jgi:hypothetical protein
VGHKFFCDFLRSFDNFCEHLKNVVVFFAVFLLQRAAHLEQHHLHDDPHPLPTLSVHGPLRAAHQQQQLRPTAPEPLRRIRLHLEQLLVPRQDEDLQDDDPHPSAPPPPNDRGPGQTAGRQNSRSDRRGGGRRQRRRPREMEDDGTEPASLAEDDRTAVLLSADPVGHCGAADDYYRVGGSTGAVHAGDAGTALLQPVRQLQEHH